MILDPPVTSCCPIFLAHMPPGDLSRTNVSMYVRVLSKLPICPPLPTCLRNKTGLHRTQKLDPVGLTLGLPTPDRQD